MRDIAVDSDWSLPDDPLQDPSGSLSELLLTGYYEN